MNRRVKRISINRPRNPVAKNSKRSGAGPHKNKKKEWKPEIDLNKNE